MVIRHAGCWNLRRRSDLIPGGLSARWASIRSIPSSRTAALMPWLGRPPVWPEGATCALASVIRTLMAGQLAPLAAAAPSETMPGNRLPAGMPNRGGATGGENHVTHFDYCCAHFAIRGGRLLRSSPGVLWRRRPRRHLGPSGDHPHRSLPVWRTGRPIHPLTTAGMKPARPMFNVGVSESPSPR
jgi:hypothetical protein